MFIRNSYDRFVAALGRWDFIALLAIRLYLLPVLYVGAHAKVTGFRARWRGLPNRWPRVAWACPGRC